jgi:tRNA(Ile)-lysidine synthase
MSECGTPLEALGLFFEEHHLALSGEGVLVACSGGPDSMALLHLLARIRSSRAPDLRLGVACLDHGLRGEAGAADTRFVEGLARELDLPVRLGRAEVGKAASGISVEEAARDARYAFLAETAREMGLRLVATGHTREDAAETFLLRLLRGSGRTGLCGLRPVRALEADLLLVRPLVDVSRAALREFLDGEGLPSRIDATNEDVRFDRNRLRRDLMPVLEAFSPGAADRLARASQILAVEESYMEAQAAEAAEPLLSGGPGRVWRLNRAGLLRLPAALQPRVLRHALVLARGDLRRIGARHLEALLRVAAGDAGAVDLPSGWRGEMEGNDLLIRHVEEGEGESPGFCYELPVPGRVSTASGYLLEAAPIEEVPRPEELAGLAPRVAVLDVSRLGSPLRVRARRPGDRIQPLGLGGRSRKVQDLLVDRKVPRSLRDGLPLVEADGRIAWVAGLEVGEPFRIHEGTSRAVRVELLEVPAAALP